LQSLNLYDKKQDDLTALPTKRCFEFLMPNNLKNKFQATDQSCILNIEFSGLIGFDPV
jgi:hypothetical protein